MKKCPICKKVMRFDNLKRHIDETHEKKLKKCECGKYMCSTSIKRHKENSCRLRNANNKNEDFVPECNSNDYDNVCNDDSNACNDGEIVEEQEFKIETKLRLVKYRDGSTKFFCDPIKAGQYYFVLNQTSIVVDSADPNGKIQF